jgi:hypothetical protein
MPGGLARKGYRTAHSTADRVRDEHIPFRRAGSSLSANGGPSGNITSILFLEDAGEWSSPVGMF